MRVASPAMSFGTSTTGSGERVGVPERTQEGPQRDSNQPHGGTGTTD